MPNHAGLSIGESVTLGRFGCRIVGYVAVGSSHVWLRYIPDARSADHALVKQLQALLIDLTFPHVHHSPSHASQLHIHAVVSGLVEGDLMSPVLHIGQRKP